MPKFVKKPENIEVIEHEDATFEATISGKPDPVIEWLVLCGRFLS